MAWGAGFLSDSSVVVDSLNLEVCREKDASQTEHILKT
jgi:hypothetical protein